MSVIAYLEALHTLLREGNSWAAWLNKHKDLLEPEELEVLENYNKEREGES